MISLRFELAMDQEMTERNAIPDVADLLALGRRRRLGKNEKFTGRTRGKSPAGLYAKQQVRGAILQCVVRERPKS